MIRFAATVCVWVSASLAMQGALDMTVKLENDTSVIELDSRANVRSWTRLFHDCALEIVTRADPALASALLPYDGSETGSEISWLPLANDSVAFQASAGELDLQ